MSNYNVLCDRDKLKKFIDFLPNLLQGEAYYVALFTRHKYCPEAKNLKDNQLARFVSSKERLEEKILRLNVPWGGYMIREAPVPESALALYISLNPRSLEMATKKLLVSAAETVAYSTQTKSYNPIELAHTAVHNAVVRKVMVDFDYDKVSVSKHFEAIDAILPKDSYRIMFTRGGFHLMVYPPKASLRDNLWYKKLSSLEGCDAKGSDALVPVPGCTQGGFIPWLM